MASTILIADDVGHCYQEIARFMSGTELAVDQARTPEECLDKTRTARPDAIVVYAAMNRAFSLMRSLRHAPETSAISLIVVGEGDQEELMTRHRQLPSRADRYLLRPLDQDSFRNVLYELLGGDMVMATLEPQVQGAASPPSAYRRYDEELAQYQAKVAQLSRDLELATKGSKELSQLRDENTQLKERILNQAPDESSQGGFSELFKRLEAGYKETIDDLERLIQEKDSIIARYAAVSGEGEAGRRAAEDELESAHSQVAEFKRALRTVVSLLGEVEDAESDLDLHEVAEVLDQDLDVDSDDAAGFGNDEKTVVVSGKDAHR